GAPYLYLADTSLGSLDVLRLANEEPRVADLMHKAIWNSDSKVQEARLRFRKTLLDQVPGAVLRGDGSDDDHPKLRKRLSVPVKAVADQRDIVIKALVNLAVELRARADSQT